MDEAQVNEKATESDKEFVTSDGDASGDGKSDYEPSSNDTGGEDEDDMEVVQKGQQNILHEKRRRSR